MNFGLSRAESRSCGSEEDKNVGHCRESNSSSLEMLSTQTDGFVDGKLTSNVRDQHVSVL